MYNIKAPTSTRFTLTEKRTCLMHIYFVVMCQLNVIHMVKQQNVKNDVYDWHIMNRGRPTEDGYTQTHISLYNEND